MKQRDRQLVSQPRRDGARDGGQGCTGWLEIERSHFDLHAWNGVEAGERADLNRWKHGSTRALTSCFEVSEAPDRQARR